MTRTIVKGKERRVSGRQMVKNLLVERQEMLVAFCRLAGLEPYTPDKPVKRRLEELCQLLMDYTAFGHFELYRRISEGDERRKQILDVARSIYPRIADITTATVEFNDKYDTSQYQPNLETLPGDLSQLGEQLAERMELEDRLVTALLQGVSETEIGSNL